MVPISNIMSAPFWRREIVAALRIGRQWVNRVTFTVGRCLPADPDQPTSSDRSGHVGLMPLGDMDKLDRCSTFLPRRLASVMPQRLALFLISVG